MDDAALILALLKSLDSKVGELEKTVSAIDKSLVGHDRCEEYRRDGVAHCRAVNAKFNTRLSRVEEICFGYVAVKEKEDAEIEETGTKLECFDTRIRKLENRAGLWDLSWDFVKGNSVLKAAFLSWFVIFAMVAYDRIRVAVHDYGLHTVIVVIGIVIICLVILWALMNRAATKRFFKL